MPTPADPTSNAMELIRLFYDPVVHFGNLTSVDSDQVPLPYSTLLDHQQHMTSTVEHFHDSLVDVNVHDVRRTEDTYARAITLTRQRDGQVVQFGIVRLRRSLLPAPALEGIESESIPLGRILIAQGVMRSVDLCCLWRVDTAEWLAERLGCGLHQSTYGRSAIIRVNQSPAIELLEIVAPVDKGS